jgi:MerR family mercuric resistance operon transcriptional regulator
MTEITKERGYAIGEMSRRTGVNIETIRYYERIGLMPKPQRTGGGNRQYGLEELKRLFFIRRCRVLGFGIEEIRALLAMVDRNDFTCAEVHGMTMAHLSSVERKISDLRQLRKALSDMAAKCIKGDVPECPIIDSLFTVG